MAFLYEKALELFRVILKELMEYNLLPSMLCALLNDIWAYALDKSRKLVPLITFQQLRNWIPHGIRLHKKQNEITSWVDIDRNVFTKNLQAIMSNIGIVVEN